MEPVTHLLTGACLSRALGLPAKARYATVACAIAAELPDADFVYRLGGPLVYFQHHRGWTHALWSLPLQAALVTGVCFLIHATRRPWKRKWREDERPPGRWLLLFGACLLALLSHILLDWTNNYGVRPFAPWNPRWYSGDLVYIVEPVLLLLLGGALLLPLLFSLVNREIGARRTPGRGMAALALVLMVCLWVYRDWQHTDAMRMGHRQWDGVQRMVMNPYPINPYRWFAVADTGSAMETGSFDLQTRSFDNDSLRVLPKPAETPAVRTAKQSWAGRVYLDWSRCPMVEEMGTAAQVHPEMALDAQEDTWKVVRFSDLRFGYPVLGRAASATVLTVEVWVDGTEHVQRVYLGGSEQRLP